jgi:hypothetical protein
MLNGGSLEDKNNVSTWRAENCSIHDYDVK